MFGLLFVICIPGFSPNSEHIPRNSECKYLTYNSSICDLMVSTDYSIYPHSLSLYTSVESPLTTLKDQSSFTYTATIRSNATFPLAAWYMPKDEEFRTLNPNLHRKNRGVVLISNCIKFRLDMIANMCKQGFLIDVYGKCFIPECNNIKRNDRFSTNWIQSKRELLSQYTYAIAFENAKEDNYVTEKVYDPLLTHTLPFYWGADNVNEFIPHPGSIITDIRYLREVLVNKKLYNHHTEGWRYLSFDKYKRRTTTLKDVLEKICLFYKKT